MREQLEKRLQDLKFDFEAGQKKLAELETQANNVRMALLRISGAIQVLEEELAKTNNKNGKPSRQSDLNAVGAGVLN